MKKRSPGTVKMFIAILFLINFTIQHADSINVTNVESYIKTLSAVTTNFDDYSENTVHHQFGMYQVLRELKDPFNQLRQLSQPRLRKTDDNLDLLGFRMPKMKEKDEGLVIISGITLGFLLEFSYFSRIFRDLHYSRKRNKVINSIVSEDDPNSFKNRAKKLHDMLIPYNNSTLRQGILMLTNTGNKKSDNQSCDVGEPPQTTIHNLYNLIILCELRGYFMRSYAHCLIEVSKAIDYYENLTIAESEMRERINDYTIAFGEVFNEELSVIRRCDPPNHEGGRTYAEFSSLRTKEMINQMNLYNEFGTENLCNQTCETMVAPIYIYNCDDSEDCNYGNRYNDHITNCITLMSEVAYCVGDTKRYMIIADSSGKFYGKYSGSCNWEEMASTDPCRICLCDSNTDLHNSRSTRSISFREQIADIARNKVVTGVKFHVRDAMLHIQVQQGDLSSGGYIGSKDKESNAHWLPLESIKFNEDETFIKDKLIFDIVTRNGEKRRMIEKEDFGAFSLDQDKINLDFLIAPRNYIITGVRFNYPRGDEENGPIQLEIHVTPFDFFLGKLIIDDNYPSKWLTPDDMRGVISEYDREREELILSDHLDDPRLLGPTKPVSEPNSYIRLQTTSLEEDVEQTVLPLIDVLEVTGDPSFGLGRINLFYKASEPRGSGFISLAIGMVNSLDYLRLDDSSE